MTTSQLLIPRLASKFDVTRQNVLNTSRINQNVGRWNLIISNASDAANLSISAVSRLTPFALGKSTERGVIRNKRRPEGKFYIFTINISRLDLTVDFIERPLRRKKLLRKGLHLTHLSLLHRLSQKVMLLGVKPWQKERPI